VRFGDPQYLWLLLLAPLVAIFFGVAHRNRIRGVTRFAEPQLAAQLAASVDQRKRGLKKLFILAALVVLVLSVARPQYGMKLSIVIRKGVDVVIALDASASMLAEDIKPNRLERAKHAMASLIDRLRGDRVAIVAFAGEGFLQCPLTPDHGAAKMFLDVIDVGTVATPGTSLGSAIETAIMAFGPGKGKHRVLVLLTDGEDHGSDPIGAARKAAEGGIRIYAIGLGSPSGEPIPLRGPNGELVEYKKDSSGETVLSRLDEATLRAIAREGGGVYFSATRGEAELEEIVRAISAMEGQEYRGREAAIYEERFQIPLLIAILLLVAEALIVDRKSIRYRRRESARKAYD
jgi:Ca-activated chloride channel family protein